jgi:cob(I)alamin adenosyltransferase
LKIYTKTGDKGETSLFGGTRVSKDSLRIETYGTVDELNSVIGICRCLIADKKIEKILTVIQNDLFVIGADLATPLETKKKNVVRINSKAITHLEKYIDAIDSRLNPLQNFILPGGSQAAAFLHYARTVCRRAERLVVKLSAKEKNNKYPLIYMNRLSDLLFVLSRCVNSQNKIADIKWDSKI